MPSVPAVSLASLSRCLPFNEISKNATNLLSEGYNTDKKVVVNKCAGNGVRYTTTVQMDQKNNALISVDTTYSHKTGISLEKFMVTTEGRIVAKGALENVFDGTRFTVEAEDGLSTSKGAIPCATLGMEYRSPHFSMDASVDAVNGPSLLASAVLKHNLCHHNSISIGGHGAFNSQLDVNSPGETSLTDYNFTLGFCGVDCETFLKSSKKCSIFDLSMYQILSNATTSAITFCYNLKNEEKVLTVGGKCEVDPTTTLGTKIDSKGIFGLVMTKKMHKGMSITASAQVNIKQFESESHKFGFSLQLGY